MNTLSHKEQITTILDHHGISYHIQQTLDYKEQVIVADQFVLDGKVGWKTVDVTEYTAKELKDWLGY